MADVRMYHNPRCSKSKRALELLQSSGMDIEIVEYLRNPPTKRELRKLISMSKLPPRDFVRTSEQAWKTLGLKIREATRDELVDAIRSNPILLQRPVLVCRDSVVIGRSDEAVLRFIDEAQPE